MALAAKKYGGTIDTVDIIDVNNTDDRNWEKYKSQNSPKKNLIDNKCDKFVNFITSNSDSFFRNTQKKYNFIFLDGSHRADDVYKEISYALKILEKNGIILLHDYFPNGNILWAATNKIIYGPYLALKRIQKDGNTIKVFPLDNLPWQTKFNTNKSSLALLSKL